MTDIVPLRRPPVGIENLRARGVVLIVTDPASVTAAASLFPDFSALAPNGDIAGTDWSMLHERIIRVWAPRGARGDIFAREIAHRVVDVGCRSWARAVVPDGCPDGWNLSDRVLPPGVAKETLRRGLLSEATLTLGDEIERLSLLSDLDLELELPGACTRWKVRKKTLERLIAEARARREEAAERDGADQQPWPEPVDGSALLGDIMRTLRRHVVMGLPEYVAVAGWVIATHVYDLFTVFPRLCVASDFPNSGKTVLLDVLSCLVRRPETSVSMTPAELAAVTDELHPTWLIDEFDNASLINTNMKALLNAGHRRGGFRRKRERNALGQWTSRRLDTYSPAAIALLGRPYPALESRSVIIRMARALPDQEVERFDAERADLSHLYRAILRWVADNRAELEAADPVMPKISNRDGDNWRPLLAIADLAGGPWPVEARRAAESLSARAANDPQAVALKLLHDMRTIFRKRRAAQLATKMLVGDLRALESSAWTDWYDARGLTAIRLAGLLKPFKIAPVPLKLGRARKDQREPAIELREANDQPVRSLKSRHSAE